MVVCIIIHVVILIMYQYIPHIYIKDMMTLLARKYVLEINFCALIQIKNFAAKGILGGYHSHSQSSMIQLLVWENYIWETLR